jgi:hypothetical protein
MADFVAVLKKTLDGLSEATPELRQKVYDKARGTIAAKLAAINPPPPQAVVDRQKRALEDAIEVVEKEYPPRPGPKISSDPLEELENVFASIERQKTEPPKPRFDNTFKADSAPRPPVPAAPVAPAAFDPSPKPEPKAEPAPKGDLWPKTTPVVAAPPAAAPARGEAPVREDVFGPENDDDDIQTDERESETRKRGYGGLIAAVIALAVIAGGGYGVWLNKDAFANLFSTNGSETATTTPSATPPATTPAQPETNTAANPPAGEQPSPAAPPPANGGADSEPKFTQRLNADGSEIDPGPAGGPAAIGEGTSVAAVTQPPETPAPAAPGATTDPAAPPAAQGQTPAAPGAPAAQPGVAVGQRAIFYEERTNVAEGSAEPGSIVWSVVQESPGGDLPPEPAIRAEATIPGKDLQLRMTIRRNADQTLPASHIIEVIFLTPDGFEGGGIENILRVSMKGSEQEAGSPLIGIPAKIADGFFLVALNDGKQEMDANMALLRRQSWIDVPIVYKSGRRALFTMEKGIPGQKAFDEAIKAWDAARSG